MDLEIETKLGEDEFWEVMEFLMGEIDFILPKDFEYFAFGSKVGAFNLLR